MRKAVNYHLFNRFVGTFSIQNKALTGYTYFHPHQYRIPGHFSVWEEQFHWIAVHDAWD